MAGLWELKGREGFKMEPTVQPRAVQGEVALFGVECSSGYEFRKKEAELRLGPLVRDSSAHAAEVSRRQTGAHVWNSRGPLA